MKALLTQYGTEQLVYVNVTYDAKRGFVDPDGNQIHAWKILDISRDSRLNSVVCGSCKTLVKNTPEAIEAHKQSQRDKKDCLQCSEVREMYDREFLKKSYTPDPKNPGKYISTVKNRVGLKCNSSWYDIHDERTEHYCKYLRCTHADYTPFSDWFVQHPHAFEVLPTVDMLVQKKWKLDFVTDRCIQYSHSRMTTLKAVVNTKGVVEEFNMHGLIGNNMARMRYSKKYDQCYFSAANAIKGYVVSVPTTIPSNKYQSALSKIKELF